MAISYMFPFLVGTTSERTGGTFTNLQAGWLYIETDGKAIYRWNGSTWDLIGQLSGTLGVAAGGTGAATLTGVLKGNGTSAITAAAQLAVADGGTGAGTLTGVLKGNGTSAITAAALLAVADGGTGAGTLTGILKGNGTSAVTALTDPLPIANGGTSGATATAGFDALSPMSALGDLIVGGASGTRTRLGIGTRNQLLKTNADITALEWGGSHLPSTKKYGAFFASSSAGGTGLFDGAFTQAASQTVAQVLTAADGKSTRYTTAAAQNSNGGLAYPAFVTMRQWNPRFKAKFKMNQTTADVRLWLGLANFVSEPSGDDQFTNPQQGVALALRAADTVFQIIHNDGSGASVYTPVSGNPSVDTNAHTIEIIADDANTKFKYSFDDGAYVDVSTDIPAQTTSLSVQAEIETNANPGTRAFEIFYLELESDK